MGVIAIICQPHSSSGICAAHICANRSVLCLGLHVCFLFCLCHVGAICVGSRQVNFLWWFVSQFVYVRPWLKRRIRQVILSFWGSVYVRVRRCLKNAMASALLFVILCVFTFTGVSASYNMIKLLLVFQMERLQAVLRPLCPIQPPKFHQNSNLSHHSPPHCEKWFPIVAVNLAHSEAYRRSSVYTLYYGSYRIHRAEHFVTFVL